MEKLNNLVTQPIRSIMSSESKGRSGRIINAGYKSTIEACTNGVSVEVKDKIKVTWLDYLNSNVT